MILNIEEIFKKLSDSEDWEPIEFINHRREMLRFEKVATIELDGRNYAYLYEIDDDGEHITEFPAVVQFEEKDGQYFLDFVTDKNIVEDVAYEVMSIRNSEQSTDGNDDLYDEDEYPEDNEYDEK